LLEFREGLDREVKEELFLSVCPLMYVGPPEGLVESSIYS